MFNKTDINDISFEQFLDDLYNFARIYTTEVCNGIAHDAEEIFEDKTTVALLAKLHEFEEHDEESARNSFSLEVKKSIKNEEPFDMLSFDMMRHGMFTQSIRETLYVVIIQEG